MVLAAVFLAVMAAPLRAQDDGLYSVKQNADNSITVTGFSIDRWERYKGPELVIPSTLYGLKVTAIGEKAFGFEWYRTRKFTSVVIPDTVTSIGKSAFEDQGLVSVTLGKGVKTIGEKAFRGNKLGGVDIPNSVIEIGEEAFTGNDFSTVIIPASVRKIGARAFPAFTNTVVIPASLSPGKGQIGSVVWGGYLVGAFDAEVWEINISMSFSITLPAGMDTEVVKLNFGETFANYYVSQGKTAGTYVKDKDRPIWVKR